MLGSEVRCPKCGYIMMELFCPECGCRYARADIFAGLRQRQLLARYVAIALLPWVMQSAVSLLDSGSLMAIPVRFFAFAVLYVILGVASPLFGIPLVLLLFKRRYRESWRAFVAVWILACFGLQAGLSCCVPVLRLPIH